MSNEMEVEPGIDVTNVTPIRPDIPKLDMAKIEEVQLPHLDIMRQCARIAHEAVCGLRQANGFGDCPPWAETTHEERSQAMHQVAAVIRQRNFSMEDIHERYVNEMQDMGWTYAEGEADPNFKTSPLLVPFAQLPLEQQQEDMVFRAVVLALYVG